MGETYHNKMIFIIPCLVMLVGLCCLFFGVKGTVDRKHKAEVYGSTQGYVISVNVNSDEDGETYGGVYEYKVKGKKYTVSDSVYTSSRPGLGDEVTIRYDTDYPEESYVEGRISGSGLLLILGAMFTLIPMIIIFSLLGPSHPFLGELVAPVILGLVFTGIGLGLLIGVKPDSIVLSIFLGFFALVGLYVIGYSIYVYIRKQVDENYTEWTSRYRDNSMDQSWMDDNSSMGQSWTGENVTVRQTWNGDSRSLDQSWTDDNNWNN